MPLDVATCSFTLAIAYNQFTKSGGFYGGKTQGDKSSAAMHTVRTAGGGGWSWWVGGWWWVMVMRLSQPSYLLLPPACRPPTFAFANRLCGPCRQGLGWFSCVT